jgi:ribonuclease VapC
MFLDASALTAMLTDESDATQLIARMETYPRRITSPLAVWETVIAVARILGLPIADSREAVEGYQEIMGVDVMAVPARAATIAIEAYDRYGKSRHPAALNFGDCFAYACASLERAPLLYKGDDFPLTDLRTA